MSDKTLLILGANSDMAKAIADEFVADGFELMLAVRNPKNDSELKFDAVDFASHQAFVKNLNVVPNVVVTAFGVLIEGEESFQNPKESLETTLVNYSGVVSILGHLSKAMAERGSGTIIGISSVAGERGRGTNYVYGSAKAGMTAYLDGLRNFLFAKGVHVMTVKPGYVDTKMKANKPTPKIVTASPQQVAKAVMRGYKNKKNTVYTVSVWRWIMVVIRNIPEFIFKRLSL
ncbi:MAG: SDR family NAD(P)-dependent oxidoreductase [Flavobacteriales bacterium]|nr:SDR family NAD(P)-dependent oxidoreductase [Flavobacteriales bacterium]